MNLRSRKNQTGATLFISLVMLLILTVLGISSVQNTGMQQVMSRNSRDATLAFQGAETAVWESEQTIEGLDTMIGFTGTNGHYSSLVNAVDLTAFDWDVPGNNANGYAVMATCISKACDGAATRAVASQPKFIVEHIKTVITNEDTLNLDNIGQDSGAERTEVFRVTTRGTGGTDFARVLLQTTYGKRL